MQTGLESSGTDGAFFPTSHLHTHKLVQGTFREHLCTSELIGGAGLPAMIALVLEVSFQEWTG